jgi:hypothetical protein
MNNNTGFVVPYNMVTPGYNFLDFNDYSNVQECGATVPNSFGYTPGGTHDTSFSEYWGATLPFLDPTWSRDDIGVDPSSSATTFQQSHYPDPAWSRDDIRVDPSSSATTFQQSHYPDPAWSRDDIGVDPSSSATTFQQSHYPDPPAPEAEFYPSHQYPQATLSGLEYYHHPDLSPPNPPQLREMAVPMADVVARRRAGEFERGDMIIVDNQQSETVIQVSLDI